MDNRTKVRALLHGKRTEGFTYPRTRSDWCRAEDSPLKDECIRVGLTQHALRVFPVSSVGGTSNHTWLLCWLLLSKKSLSHVGLLGQVRICHCHHCFFPNILNSWSTCKATSSFMQDSMDFLSPFLLCLICWDLTSQETLVPPNVSLLPVISSSWRTTVSK